MPPSLPTVVAEGVKCGQQEGIMSSYGCAVLSAISRVPWRIRVFRDLRSRVMGAQHVLVIISLLSPAMSSFVPASEMTAETSSRNAAKVFKVTAAQPHPLAHPEPRTGRREGAAHTRGQRELLTAQGLEALTSGVTVISSNAEGQHPWINIENFTTDCPAGDVFSGVSGTCSASFDLYNDSGNTLSGYAGYDLDLEPSPGWPIWYSSETEICRQGIYNGEVRCSLYQMNDNIVGGTIFKAHQYVDMAPWTRLSISKTIHWTLDPDLWWVPSRSARSSCSTQYGFSDQRECGWKTGVSAQGFGGDPINTQNGSFDYSVLDVSVTTPAGPLSLGRTYASLLPVAGKLGFGWTHNHDVRLIFEADPGGEKGVVWFKAHSANEYAFLDNGDGTYTATSGLNGTLSKQSATTITYTVDTAHQEAYVFAEDGRLQSWSDSSGRTWTYSYDANGLLDLVTDDTTGRYLDFDHDTEGRLATVADHTGRQISYSYDAAGDLIGVVDILGRTWTYGYDGDHHLTSVTDPDAVVTLRVEYDAEGRAIREYNGANELIVELTYNADGTTTVTDGKLNSSTHDYDSRNTLTGTTDSLGGLTSKSYDSNFRPTAITDADGDTTQLAWSADGSNLIQVIDGEGNQTDLAYDALNNLTSVTDPRGFLTTYTYSGTLLTSTTDALNNTTSYTYTDSLDAPAPEGLLESVTDPRGNTTSYTYDEFGQRTSMADALGNTWTYLYDALGNLVDTTDPFGRVTHNEYDAAGRLVRTTRNYDPARMQNDQGQYNIVTEYVYDAVGNQTQVIDTFGRITLNEYDNAGRLVKTTENHDPARPANDQNEYNLITTYGYDVNGNLTSVTDPLGRTTNHTYDELNRLTSTTDPLGNTTTTTYNPDGTVASTTDALGNTTSFTYDNLKRVVTTTDPVGNATSTSYDAAGNVASTTDANGNTTSYTYDAVNRQIKVTDALLGVTEHSYDAAGNRTRTVDANGNATSYGYDALNRLVSITDARGYVTNYTYDAVGNRVSVTDARTNMTTYSYDLLDRLVSVTDALNHVSSTEYDALGNVTARVDANGNRTSFRYDTVNRLVEQTDPLAGITSFAYDPVGNQTGVTDARGNTTTTAYDALNRPMTVTDPNGNATSTDYDAAGNVISVTDPLGNVTSYTYDAAYRQTGSTDPLANTTSFGYDPNGNRTSMTDPAGVETRYEYDALNRLVAVVENYVAGATPDADTNVRTEYTYDGVGNRLTIKDANGNTTSFTYTATNQLASEEDPILNTTSYGYDQVGNRTTLTDALGNVTLFSYDANNRLSGIDYPAPDVDATFTYDAVGNRTSMTDGMGTTTWSYDALNRVTAVTDPFGDTVSYAYDAVGNRTTLTYPDTKSVAYVYDPANRLIQVTDWSAAATDYTYDAADRMTGVALPNGVDSTYSYNAAGWLTSIDHSVGLESLSSFQYTYDPVGNRVSAVEVLALPSSVASLSNPSMAGLSAEEAVTSLQGLEPDAAGSGWFPASFSAQEPTATPTAEESDSTATPTESEPTPTSTPEATTPTTEPTTTPSPTATVEATRQIVAGDWVVNSTADSSDADPGDGECDDSAGACTLRAAIEEANAWSGPNTVTFNIPGDGVQTIRLTAPLPEISEPLTLDGSTQPGYAGVPRIAVDGSEAGDGADGLHITGGESTVRALALFGFSRAAILITGTGGNTVESSFIGLSPEGVQATRNQIGILVQDSAGNRIGGEAGSGNEISANTIGVYILGPAAHGNSVVGNDFGVDERERPSHPNAIDIRIKDAAGSSVAGRPGESKNQFGRAVPEIHLEGIGSEEVFFQDGALERPFQRPAAPELVPLEGRGEASGGGLVSSARAWLRAVYEFIRGEWQVFLMSVNGSAEGVADEPVLIDQRSHASGGSGLFAVRMDSSTEPLAAGLVFTVNTTDDRGDKTPGDGVCEMRKNVCSLRAAIEEANASAGTDTIQFDISGTGPHTIQANKSPLPSISEPVVIDATTQSGYAGTPVIELDGNNAGVGANGLTIAAGSSTVRGLAINRFDGYGVELNTNGGNVIEANHLGLNPAGTQSLPNGAGGLLITGSSNNMVGGTTAAARNVISGNQQNGIYITGLASSGNSVLGNFIGTDGAGSASLGNVRSGIGIDGAPNNTIGGTASGDGNVISGNKGDGVYIVGTDATGNELLGNTIGLNASGAALGNGQDGTGHGVKINASSNTVGGTTASARNVISGNAELGIYIVGTTGTGEVTNNVVLGNFIGTDAGGSAAIGNGLDGVMIDEADNNTIGGSAEGAGNVLSGNGDYGVYLFGASATGNVVQGNLIGLNADGTAALGNGSHGTLLWDAPGNTIGGDVDGAGNVISGNTDYGVYIFGAGSDGNMVQGNLIGTDAAGAADLGNLSNGVTVAYGASNTVGGSTASARNVISGNDQAGVVIAYPDASGNLVQANFIGTDAAGTAALGNAYRGVQIQDAPNNTIGGTATGEGNVIAASGSHGIRIVLAGATGNLVQGNFIGTDIDGALALGNTGAGISITAAENTVGGTLAGSANVIANNGADGIFVDNTTGNTGFAVNGNALLGNSIGDNAGLGIDLDPDGVTANDAGDPDTGANDLQNFPGLTSAVSDGSSTTVEGSLNSAPSTTYRLEFFSNPACDASGNGEGRTFLGSADVTTDANGDVSFSVPVSAGVGSGEAVTATATDPGGSTSELSGCVEAIETVSSFNWHYEYDALYRLTYACSDWDNVATACKSNEAFFRYTYDGVGNRLTQETLSGTNSYTYDAANRLTSVDGVSYSWDAKGNLLSDGAWSYTYNHANRLVSADDGVDSYDFAYNGRGDRLRQTVNGVATGYTLDINRGLTQVLADGSNTYLYGASRIGEVQSSGWQYHHGNALGSVRQLTDPAGVVTATRSYEPFGSTLTSTGSVATNYAFTGEWADSTGLIYLRARYLIPTQGRFLQADPSRLESNLHLYGNANPIMNRDPSGLFSSSVIAHSLSQPSFTSVMNWVEARGDLYPRWGLLQLLLDANDLDRIQGVTLQNFGRPAEIPLGFFLTLPDCSIGVYADRLYSLPEYIESLPQIAKRMKPASIPGWRTVVHRYRLNGRTEYRDTRYTDLPDFYSVGVGGEIEFNLGGGSLMGHLITDRFGRDYIGISSTLGLGYSFTLWQYTEGYVDAKVREWGTNYPISLTENQLEDALTGATVGGSYSIFLTGAEGAVTIPRLEYLIGQYTERLIDLLSVSGGGAVVLPIPDRPDTQSWHELDYFPPYDRSNIRW